MNVAEVEDCADQMLAALPAELVEACGDITIHVAAHRGDLAVLRAAVTESGQAAVAIPQDFRAVFLGSPLDPAIDWDDPANDYRGAADSDEGAGPSGVIVLNAALMRDAEDVLYTLLHELGHALGYDEDEITALGLE